MKKILSIILTAMLLCGILPSAYAVSEPLTDTSMYEDFSYYAAEDFVRTGYTANPQEYTTYAHVATTDSKLSIAGKGTTDVSFSKKLDSSLEEGVYVFEVKYTTENSGAEIALLDGNEISAVSLRHALDGKIFLCGEDTGITSSNATNVARLTVDMDADMVSCSIYDENGENEQSSTSVSIADAAIAAYCVGTSEISTNNGTDFDYLYMWNEDNAPVTVGKDLSGYFNKQVLLHGDKLETGSNDIKAYSATGGGLYSVEEGYPTIIRGSDTSRLTIKRNKLTLSDVTKSIIELSYEVDTGKQSYFYMDFKYLAIADTILANGDNEIKLKSGVGMDKNPVYSTDSSTRNWKFEVDYTNKKVKAWLNDNEITFNDNKDEPTVGGFSGKTLPTIGESWSIQSRGEESSEEGPKTVGVEGAKLAVKKYNLYKVDTKTTGEKLTEEIAKLSTSDIAPIPEAVTDTLKLPKKCGNATLAWSSGNVSVIDNDGKITPQKGKDTTVIMTAKATMDGTTIIRTYPFVVLKRTEADYEIAPDKVEDFNFVSLEDYLADGVLSIPGYKNFCSLSMKDSALTAEVTDSFSKNLSVTKPVVPMQGGVLDLRLSRTNGLAFEFSVLDKDYNVLAKAAVKNDGSLFVNDSSTECSVPTGESILRIAVANDGSGVYTYDNDGKSKQTAKEFDASGEIAFYRLTVAKESTTQSKIEFRQLVTWDNPDGNPLPVADMRGGYDEDMMRVVVEHNYGFGSGTVASSNGYKWNSGLEEDGEITVKDGYPTLIRNSDGAGRIKMAITAMNPNAYNADYLKDKLRLEIETWVDTTKQNYFYYDLGFTYLVDRNTKDQAQAKLTFNNAEKNVTDTGVNFTLEDDGTQNGIRRFALDIDYVNDEFTATMYKENWKTPFATNSSPFRKSADSLGDITIESRGAGENSGYGGVGSAVSIRRYRILKNSVAHTVLAEKAAQISFGKTDTSAVTGNISLPDEILDSSVSWESNAPDVITNDGTVTRPENEDKKVVLYATVSDGDSHMKKAFVVNVAAQNPTNYYFLKSNTLLSAGNEWSFTSFAQQEDGMVILDNSSASVDLIKKGDIGLGGNAIIELEIQNENGTGTAEIIGNNQVLVVLKSEDGKLFANDTATELDVSDKKKLKIELDIPNKKFIVYSSDIPLTDALDMKNTASCIDKLAFNGKIKIGSPRGYNLVKELPTAILSQIAFVNFTDEPINSVTGNLKIPTSEIGNVTYTFKSTHPCISDEGKVVRNGQGDVTGKITLTAAYGDSYTDYREYEVTVAQIGPEIISYLKTVTADIQAASDSELSYLTDGIEGTAFISRGRETSAEFIMDLESEYVIGEVEIVEKTPCIEEVKIYSSKNNKNWELLYTGAPQNILSYIGNGRYVKISVTKKKEQTPLNISEIVIKKTYTDKQAVLSDMKTIRKLMPAAGESLSDFTLPADGDYGTTVTITADRSFVNISEKDSKYYITHTTPQTSGSVLLTLTIEHGSEKDYVNLLYTVGGSGTNEPTDNGGGGGSSGSSGGGSSGGGGGGFTAIKVIPPVTEENPKTEFGDVSKNHWAKDYIYNLYNAGIISGVGNGLFHPERSVTREEFIKMLLASLPKLKGMAVTLHFKDTDSNAWYYPYIEQAFSLGLTKGESDDRFGVGKPITRQDICVMLRRALLILGYTDENIGELLFGDIAEIAEYARDSVAYLSNAGIISGYNDGDFKPAKSATRAETAKILCMVRARWN